MLFAVVEIKVRLRQAVAGNSPPDCCTWMVQIPRIKKERTHSDAFFMARSTEKDINALLVFYRYCSFRIADDLQV